MRGEFIRGNSTTLDAEYVRLLTLFNYQMDAGSVTRYCGFKFYRSNTVVSSLRVKTSALISYSNDSAWQASEGATTIEVIDHSGNIDAARIKNVPASWTDSGLPLTGKAADSDKLDGLNSSQFLRSDTSDEMSGTLAVDAPSNSALRVGENSGTKLLIDGSGEHRPYVQIRGSYPHLELIGTTSNNNHGATIRFASTTGDDQMVIGSSSSTCKWLDFGYSNPPNYNPHSGISDHLTPTIMRLHGPSGNISIGSITDGGEKLTVSGKVKATAFIGDGSQLTGVSSLPESNAASRGSALTSDGEGGSFWAYIGATGSGQLDNTAWRYRSIYTHGYLAGGYKGSNVWRSVNKTWHNTDTTIYCGEQLHNGSSYQNGMWSDLNAYVTCGAGTMASSNSGTGKLISSYSLHNGSQRHHNNAAWGIENAPYGYTGHNPVGDGVGLSYGSVGGGGDIGGMGMKTDRQGAACGQDIKGQAGYITGGGSTTTEKMHFATEIMYVGPDFGNSAKYLDGASGELKGYFFNNKQITWSTDSIAAWSGFSGTSHKWYMSTKHGHHYAQDGQTTKRKFSDATGASISTFSKVTSYNEENPEDGQDHGYILGHYNGQQNNWTIKQSYTVDTEVTMGAACQPKGHFGQSSGCCSTAAATVTASFIGV
jgi:hypothetical protein